MSNNQDDFLPEVRNSAWWSGDSRKAANGKAVEAILIKQGKLSPPDLSEVEAVQMGHVMQPVIGRLAQQKLQVELKDADYALTHPKESWLRSHFDFISGDGTMLVEAKNYNAAVRSKFDVETNRVPDADYAQCLHEATVHNVSKVCLAVLFGGAEFQTFEFTFSDQEKQEFIQTQSVYWGYVQTNQTPEPTTIEQTKLIYPVANDSAIIATQQVERAVAYLKQVKQAIKQQEEVAEGIEAQIRAYMAQASEIRSVDGSTLVSWKNSKSSKKFSSAAFQEAMPDLYQKFVIEQAGSRRFLIK